MKRKHVVVVEMTFDEPVTGKVAKHTVHNLILLGRRVEDAEGKIYQHPDITTFNTKDGARVFASIESGQKK